MAKVSIVVPVYNAEKYLIQCLDSILAQTLKDIEVICVDDGSTDHSREILDRYAVKDNRIKVLHRENKGYGAAMNAGMDAAVGEYIGIVESDDCILPEMYQVLYDASDFGNLDVIKSEVYFWYEKYGHKSRKYRKYLDNYYNRVLYGIDRNIFFNFYMNIWTGIYKRSFLINYNIRFHESPGASYQDNGFWLQTLIYCKTAKWLNKAFYLYRQDNESASIKSKANVLTMTREYEYIEKVLLERKDYANLSYCYYYKLIRHRGNFYRIADEYKLGFCEQLKKDYLRYQGYIKDTGYLNEWYQNILSDPEKFCCKVIETKSEIYKRLNTAKGLVIYGAGNHGDFILRCLVNEGYYEKIICFATTTGDAGERLAKKPILKIDTVMEENPEALVIIAVIKGSGMYRQMLAKLEELNVTEYIAGSDMENLFYIL